MDRTTKNRYVYRHCYKTGPKSGNPFYIGRGTHHPGDAASNETFYNRAYSYGGRTNWWARIVKKYGVEVEIVMDNLTFDEAVGKEIEFIALYGLMLDGGMLCNMSTGGTGMFGYKHTPESIAKFRDKRRAKYTLDRQLDEHISFEPTTGCWLWTGTFVEKYPKININGQTLNAVRTVYQHITGVNLTPKKQSLFNICGCNHCVNPQHYRVHQSSGKR